MARYFLDSSALAKAYHAETGTPKMADADKHLVAVARLKGVSVINPDDP